MCYVKWQKSWCSCEMMEVQEVLFSAVGVADKITRGESKCESRELTLGWRERTRRAVETEEARPE